MNKKQLKANVLLLLAAMIWGFGFVAQKLGADHVGAFTFNAIRFILGALFLLPFLLLQKRRQSKETEDEDQRSFSYTLKGGILVGSFLFLGAFLQQLGMAYTTASKAGFLVSLYIVLVPVLGFFLKQKTGINIWVGVILALVGLYLLSINENFTMELGDLLMILSAFAYAAQILMVGAVTKYVNPIKLSFIQFLTGASLNFVGALIFENISFVGIGKAGIAILYSGLLSIGVANTLQVVAQKDAEPAHTAILMSMESVFSCIGGMIILHERLNGRGTLGCIIIFSAIIVSQLPLRNRKDLEASYGKE